MTAPLDQQPTSATEECSDRCSFCGKGPKTFEALVQGRDLRVHLPRLARL